MSTEKTDAEASAPSGWGTAQRRATGLLGLALVVALVAVVVLALHRGGSDAGSPSSSSAAATQLASDQAAETAARAAVVRMTTYHWQSVAKDFSWVDTAGTAKFKSYFAATSAQEQTLIKRIKASATGTVRDSATTGTDPDHVKVLLFVDQRITAQGEKGAKLDQPRVTMQMVMQDGRWLVDSVVVNDLLNQ